MIYTDEDGNKFEFSRETIGLAAGSGEIVIKPIKKADEKKAYKVQFCTSLNSDNDSWSAKTIFREELTASQAKAIADFIKAGMEAITTNNRLYFNGEVTQCFEDAAKLLQKEQER